jgi:hypothetical protein
VKGVRGCLQQRSGGVEVFGGCLAGHESGLDARGYDVVRANHGTCISAPAIVSTVLCTFTTMSGPVPSNLVLLSDLPTCAAGTKVRFLGWYYERMRWESQKLTVSQYR